MALQGIAVNLVTHVDWSSGIPWGAIFAIGEIMAKGEDLYARLEVGFVRSFEFQKYSLGARILYLSLWCYSLEKRRQLLPRPTDDYLRSLAGLKRHDVSSYLRSLHDGKLLDVTEMTIDVLGIMEKHKQFQWKDESIGDQTPPNQNQTPPQERNRTKPNSAEPKKNKTKKKKPITFSQDQKKFSGIAEDQIKSWKEAYPDINVALTIRQAEAWYTANPAKHKKNIQRFLTNWLSRTQKDAMEKSGRDNRGGNDYDKYD